MTSGWSRAMLWPTRLGKRPDIKGIKTADVVGDAIGFDLFEKCPDIKEIKTENDMDIIIALYTDPLFWIMCIPIWVLMWIFIDLIH